jgi:hypothetical protein
MGMYASGPYVEDMKLNGLVAEAIMEAKQRQYWGHTYAGVETEMYKGRELFGSVVTLTRDEVRAVVALMREKLLRGWARECHGWADSFEGVDQGAPLSYLQDVYTFERGVSAFSNLATWLAHTDEEKITWA